MRTLAVTSPSQCHFLHAVAAVLSGAAAVIPSLLLRKGAEVCLEQLSDELPHI